MLDAWNICEYTWIGKIKTFRSKPWILMVYFVMWIEEISTVGYRVAFWWNDVRIGGPSSKGYMRTRAPFEAKMT